MRATLLGHACWLFETTVGCFLMDPVLFDPFEEGTVTACPRRAVRVDQLPGLQGIVVSHRHLDHFDLPSLAALDRCVPVFCPDDPFLLYGLQRLGFRHVHRLAPCEPQQFGALRLLPTPSLHREVLEYGLVWRDETGTIFNQVDTFLAAETIDWLRREVGQLDVHLAMYASQNFHFFENKRDNTAAMHAINLHTASCLGARCVVPAAAGFRFVDDLAWLNQHVFPISRAKFLRDFQQIDAAPRTAVINPGDTLEVKHGDVTVHRQAAGFVTMLEDDTHLIAYDASAPIPPLTDRNPAGYGLQGLEEFTQGVLERGLAQYLAQSMTTGEPLTMQYLQYAVSYEVAVVFPNGKSRFWTYHFDRQRQAVQCQVGSGTTVPDVRQRITASALVDLCLGRRSYFAVRTQSRRSVQVCAVVQTARGIVGQEVDLPDLLTHYVINAMAGAERRGKEWIDFMTRDLKVSIMPGGIPESQGGKTATY
jgi:UDP-MurNAc hydroxylase